MPPKKATVLMTNAAIKQMIAQGVADALAEHEANRNSRNGNDSHDSGNGRRRQWFEKMEYVFQISNYTVACQIKFATCTLLGNALTWWNSHFKTVGHDAAYEMPWKTLKKMMTTKYCPRSAIKKLEIEIWNLKARVLMLKRISEKRTKNQAKTDKIEHGMEKREKTKSNRSQSQVKAKKSTKVKGQTRSRNRRNS
ncbi:reverse transcriptase domain-containing protein [Tanacetum coccineum]